MKSKIIVGCRECEKELFQKKAYGYRGYKGLQLPFPVFTAYEYEDLSELLLGFTCDFCEKELMITTKMMKFIATFFEKEFNINVINQSIYISNGELSFSIPIEQEIKSVQEYLSNYGLKIEDTDDTLPTEEDIKLMQEAAREYNHYQWMFSLKSGHLLSPLSKQYQYPYDPMA